MIKIGLAQRLLALICGGVCSLSFAPFGHWPLALLCIALLFHAVYSATTTMEKFLRGFLFGVGKFSVGTHWVLDSLINHADANPITGVLLFTLMICLLSLLFSLACCFAFELKSKLAATALFAGVVCLYEVLMSFPIGFSFPLLHTGYAFVATPIAAYAPIGGVWLVGYGAVFSAVALYFVFRRSYLPFILSVAMWMVAVPMKDLLWTSREGDVTVALVQADIESSLSTWVSDPNSYWQAYRRLTNQGRTADLVLWPESALPANRHSVQPLIEQLVGELDGSLVLGTFEHKASGLGRETFNVAIIAGKHDAVYQKQQLVPFGEYTPDLWLMHSVFEHVDFPMSHMTEGSESDALLRAGDLVFKVAICYEIAYPELVRRELGTADFIVSLNADAWFGNSLGPWQQLQVARMRARESGKYLLRVSNVGPTAVVRSDGSIQRALPVHEAGVLSDRVEAMAGSTPFVRYGLLPIVTVLLLSFTAPLIGLVRSSTDGQ